MDKATVFIKHDDADLLTMEEFIGGVNCKGFTDYDGFGYYAWDNCQSNIVVNPSDLAKGTLRNHFTHVMWYNR